MKKYLFAAVFSVGLSLISLTSYGQCAMCQKIEGMPKPHPWCRLYCDTSFCYDSCCCCNARRHNINCDHFGWWY